MPQASPICTTAVSLAAEYLAIGLASGVIITWNLKRCQQNHKVLSYHLIHSLFACADLCCNVQQVTCGPEKITDIEFYNTSQNYHFVIGTNQGSILLMNKEFTIVSINQR